MHPKPAAGFRLAFHHADEVLALLLGEGDTLHGRPFLWWLGGFGVFTMPQEMAVCSIILCIYLVPLSPSTGPAAYGCPARRP